VIPMMVSLLLEVVEEAAEEVEVVEVAAFSPTLAELELQGMRKSEKCIDAY